MELVYLVNAEETSFRSDTTIIRFHHNAMRRAFAPTKVVDVNRWWLLEKGVS
jgi:hypothetical protein